MEDLANHRASRRNFLLRGGTVLGVAVLGSASFLACTEKAEKAEVTATEDLMREHGVLRRILLIFDEMGERLRCCKDFAPTAVVDAAGIIRRFIQDYHEKLEEEHLFPRFEQANKMVALVKILRDQHEVGRRVIDYLMSHAGAASSKKITDRAHLGIYLGQFTRLYRPHAAREDTVLFPALRGVMPAKEFAGLSEVFEKKEQELFGKEGFEKVVDEVARIEEAMGLNDLTQFTPRL